jgi:WD40 repeat protein
VHEKGPDEVSPNARTSSASSGDQQRQHVRQQARLSLSGHRGTVSCIDVSVPSTSAVGEDLMQGDEDLLLPKLVVSGGVDGTVRVWDWVSGKSVAVLAFTADAGQHQADVGDMSVVGASAGAGAMAQIARATAAEETSEDTAVAQATEAVTCVALQCGGRQLVAGGANGTLRTWKIDGSAMGVVAVVVVVAVRTIRQAHVGAITCLHAGDRREGHLADPSRLVTASADHTIRVWDLNARRPQVHCLRGHADAITALTVDAQLWLAISGSRDQSVRVWDLRSGRAVRTAAEGSGASANGHFGAVHCIALDGAGRGRFLSGARDSSLKVWDTQSPLSSSASSTSANAAVVASADPSAVSTSGSGLACVATLRGHTRAITCLDVRQHEGANGSSRAVSGSSDGTLRVWDFHRQRCHATCVGHQAPVTTVMWVAHRRILSGSTDGTLRLWDAASGFNLCTYEGHRGGVTAVRFDTGGIVSSSKDGVVRIFDGGAFE